MSIAYLITTKTISRICWLVINLIYLATALKDVRVIVPGIVKRGDNATLSCYYDLQNDTLYSVKWYKGKREFYRYTPRQTPPMKVFPHSGIHVEPLKSNESHLLLTSVGPTVSGKYSCEVSADAPSFDTDIMSGDLEVVEIPETGPRIDATDKVYSIGDILSANCTQENSRPAANLTWLINNLTLACIAKIYNIYQQITEKLIDLDASTNLILFDSPWSTPENTKQSKYANTLGELNEDIKMHHMQAQDSSSAAASNYLCLSYLPWSKTSAVSKQNSKKVLYHLGAAVTAVFVAHTLMSSTRLVVKLRRKQI